MNCTEKIKAIEQVFREYHDPDDESDMDSIDVCMKIERILKK